MGAAMRHRTHQILFPRTTQSGAFLERRTTDVSKSDRLLQTDSRVPTSVCRRSDSVNQM